MIYLQGRIKKTHRIIWNILNLFVSLPTYNKKP